MGHRPNCCRSLSISKAKGAHLSSPICLVSSTDARCGRGEMILIRAESCRGAFSMAFSHISGSQCAIELHGMTMRC